MIQSISTAVRVSAGIVISLFLVFMTIFRSSP